MSIHKPRDTERHGGRSYWLYGAHAVEAALSNRRRGIRRILATVNALPRLEAWLDLDRHPKPEMMDAKQLEKQLHAGAVHQGIAAEVEPLEELSLIELLSEAPTGPIIVLDQVTDPHNVGAVLRSAAAFGAAAVLATDRGAPTENAVIAKSASGAMEHVPLITVGNLSQAFEQLKKSDYWIAGMSGEAEQTIAQAKLTQKTALVMGAEGKGLRRLTAERCDFLVKIPIAERMESLNVSNAAAVALYELYRSRP